MYMFYTYGYQKSYRKSIDMFLLVAKRMRRGISYIAKRYSKANNKYRKSYDNINQVNISCICTEIIYVVGKRVNIFLPVIWIVKSKTDW